MRRETIVPRMKTSTTAATMPASAVLPETRSVTTLVELPLMKDGKARTIPVSARKPTASTQPATKLSVKTACLRVITGLRPYRP